MDIKKLQHRAEQTILDETYNWQLIIKIKESVMKKVTRTN